MVYGVSVYLPFVAALSATAIQPGIRHIDNTVGSGTYSIHVTAIQMTPTSATG